MKEPERVSQKERPSWCPHQVSCELIRTTQDVICCGKMISPEKHGPVNNTNYLCLNAQLNDESKSIVTDLQIYDGDLWWLIEFLKEMRTIMKKENKA